MKILITGGSGFIGTNLIDDFLLKENIEILNLDIAKPKIESHISCWRNVDIRNLKLLQKVVNQFNPSIVIHLAARTDLNGFSLEDYDSNTKGVENLLTVLEPLSDLRRVIFTSSMYVCAPGYTPSSDHDYNPHTIYGQSKVQTEKIIRAANSQSYNWCIIRPTSIWGPWFGEPYANFFKIVMSKKYFHLGERACSKTYGYIGNTTYQIVKLIEAPSKTVHNNLYYIGDWPEYDISEWADEIANFIGIRIPRIPFFLFRVAALVGDILKAIGIKFPMTSFRLKNMTTNNVQDLNRIQEIAPVLPISRKEGIKLTVEWINRHSI